MKISKQQQGRRSDGIQFPFTSADEIYADNVSLVLGDVSALLPFDTMQFVLCLVLNSLSEDDLPCRPCRIYAHQ